MPLTREADLPVTVDRVIPQSWTDYNGHMNEAHYLEAGAQATDAFMVLIKADADYIAGGHSYFTVENHLRYLDEMKAGEVLRVRTQVMQGEGKKLHLFHFIENGAGETCATMETMLLHVSLRDPAVLCALTASGGGIGRLRAGPYPIWPSPTALGAQSGNLVWGLCPGPCRASPRIFLNQRRGGRFC